MADVKHFDPDIVLDTALRLFWQQGAGATGIQDLVTATGVNRSSLYATFGDKRGLYLSALDRYVERRSRPMFDRLAGDERGLPAISAFFTSLIQARCFGEYARWGCMVSNAYTAAENHDPDAQRILERHHQELRAALLAALRTAARRRQLRRGVDPETAAGTLALLAYGVNLRSRAGADAKELRASVAATLALIGARSPSTTEE